MGFCGCLSVIVSIYGHRLLHPRPPGRRRAPRADAGALAEAQALDGLERGGLARGEDRRDEANQQRRAVSMSVRLLVVPGNH